MGAGVDLPTVYVDASSSSSSDIPDSVERSVYEFRIEDTRILEEVVEKRMVSASELAVEMVDIVDIVDTEDGRREDIVEARSEPELEDVATPMSCLCAPQCTSGIEV